MRIWGRHVATADAIARLAVASRPTEEPSRNAGEYQLLYKYLRDRYANRIVLTFAEIEDLLGFALPDAARLQPAWWSVAPLLVPPSAQSRAWVLARRTATVNLAARNVLFDREI